MLSSPFTPLQIEQIQQRLSIALPKQASLANIEIITRAMVNSLPFENLDVLAGKQIQDALEHVFEKSILNPRGGLCFELNALLLAILHHLNVPCYRIAAQMVVDGELRDEANHLALVAEISGKQYLVDIGDGRGIWGLLPLDGSYKHQQLGTSYKVVGIAPDKYQLQFEESGQTQVRYQFKDQPMQRGEFARARRFIESDPLSVFNKRMIVSRIQDNTRITLSETQLIISDLNHKKAQEYAEKEREQLLDQYFGIRL